MIVKCPKCGQSNRVPENAAGKKVVCGKCMTPLVAAPAGDGKPLVVTDSSFASVTSGGKPVVVDFWAPWCGPCRVIGPVIEDLAKSRHDVVFAKLNVDENRSTQAKFQVSGIPTLIFFRDGQEKGRIVGAVGRPQIEQAIRQYLAT